MASIKNKSIGLLILFIAAGSSLAKENPPLNAVYRLFPIDRHCNCTVAKARTRTLESSEITEGRKVFQVFRNRNSPRELFRLELGSPTLKWWHYGISSEGDFNGDGIPDYSWYGGDDTSDEVYLFLSSGDSYRKVDIYRSFEREWTLTFHKRAPDFANFGQEFVLDNIRLIRDSGGLVLASEYVSSLHPEKTKRKMRVDSGHFVYSD